MNKDYGFRLLKDKDGYYAIAYHDEKDGKWYRPELATSGTEIDVSEYKIIEDDIDCDGYIKFNHPKKDGYYLIKYYNNKRGIGYWSNAIGTWYAIKNNYDDLFCIEEESSPSLTPMTSVVSAYKELTQEILSTL